MLIHPQFNPVALDLGLVQIHWYALSYLLGFFLFIKLGKIRIKQGKSVLLTMQLDDLLTYGILGVVLGGRLGYVLFYQPAYFMAHPADIIKIWEGGMSFHGGLIGVLVALYLFARNNTMRLATLMDTVAPLVPLGLASGRLGNFINGELWGRITAPDAFWAMGFPSARMDDLHMLPSLEAQYHTVFAQYGVLPRHPSQLYEFALEGIVLFIILWIYSSKERKAGQVASLFLMGYAIARFIVELTRQPDAHLGLLAGGLSMGQWLSIPMFVIGLIVFIRSSLVKIPGVEDRC